MLRLKRINGIYYLNINNINSNSVFLSIFLGITIPHLIRLIYKLNIVIKMPDVVPDEVSKSFESVVPSLFIIAICFFLI